MPITPTYPGVYIEEVPSGVRTITGVATSITAFIGRALDGPVNTPTPIFSFADYERLFGGLWVESTMSYAVRDFYLNGGNQALIIRLQNGASRATITLPSVDSPPDSLELEAAYYGSWGGKLKASVNHKTKDADEAAPDKKLFNLIVSEDKEGGRREVFLNVSVDANDPRYVPRVLEQSSQLVQVSKDSITGTWKVPGSRPASTLLLASPPTSPPKEKDYPVSATGGGDGSALTTNDYLGSENDKEGIYALEKADLFNLLCIPPPTRSSDTNATVYQEAMKYCENRRAVLIVDSPIAWGTPPEAAARNASDSSNGLSSLGLSGVASRNAALYFPRVKESDPLQDGQLDTFAPCGIIAGVMARTDTQRGVWKAPAGLDAAMNGIQGLQANLTDDENGLLNPLGINCLRVFPVNGRVVWGARTLRGADQLADEYKYVSVRRTALYIEESLYRGTQWVVFEPNDEPLWAQIRMNVGAFMHNLFRQGAFQGSSPREAYLVKCDKDTTTQNDIDRGIVNILVGFAPLKPAEFVIIKIQQLAGQVES